MNTLKSGRKPKIVGAALAVSVVLAACGGSGGGGGSRGPSALDPANMVPAGSVVYMSVALKPQGSMKSDLTEAIDSVAGKGVAARLYARFEKSAGKKWTEIQSWAGQRVGIALTGLPVKATGGASFVPHIVFVIPTSNPSAAKTWLAKQKLGSTAAGKVVGHYVIFGGKTAFSQALATTGKTSLATEPGFKSDMAELGSHELFTAYTPLHQLYQRLLGLLKSSPSYSASTLSAAAKQAPPGSSVAFGMAALHNQFRIDVVEHGTPTTSTPASAVASDVSSLPGSAWLAVALGGALAKGSTVSQLTSSLSKELGAIQSLNGKLGNRVPSGPLGFVEQDLLPALGPAELSVSGTSSTTLQAGLVMAPDNKSAGARLAKAVKQLVSGLPISSTWAGGRVAVTFGISKLQELLNPSSKLGDNPSFKRALAQLPAGAKADVYLNFEPITALASLDQGAVPGSAMKVLHQLDYLIAGGTHSHFRLVLTTY